jgi:hypothetical protein
MNTALMATRLRFALRRLGWPAWLGMALLLAIWPVAHWGADVHRERAQALREEARSAQPVRPVLDEETQASLRQQRTQARLAEPVAALAVVEQLHRSAAAHSLQLATGEYRLLPAAGALPARYQIQLPVNGRYPHIRAWLGDAMNTQPGLALDELSFSRATVADAALQARVRWTLYLKAN